MAKILISNYSCALENGSFQVSCFYEGLINALKRNGNDVLHLISNDYILLPWAGQNVFLAGVKEKALAEEIKNFAPDLAIVFNNSTIPSLNKIIDCPILIWDADSQVYFNSLTELKKNSSRYHFISFAKSGCVELAKTFGLPLSEVHHVPPATDVVAIAGPQPRNIVFIGTHFQTPIVFKHAVLDQPELRNSLLKALETSEGDFFKSLEMIKNLPENLKISFSLIYSANTRVKSLDAIAPLGIEIFGSQGWIDTMDFSYRLALSFNNRAVYSLGHNQDLYNTSKVSFSISHNQSTTGFPWRIFDVMASASCLLSDDKRDLREETKAYVDLPFYKTPEEAKAVCAKLLADDALRAQIVKASNQYVNEKCRFENRFKDFEQMFKGLKLLNAHANAGTYRRLWPEEFEKSMLLNRALSGVAKFVPRKPLRISYQLLSEHLGFRFSPNLVKRIKGNEKT